MSMRVRVRVEHEDNEVFTVIDVEDITEALQNLGDSRETIEPVRYGMISGALGGEVIRMIREVQAGRWRVEQNGSEKHFAIAFLESCYRAMVFDYDSQEEKWDDASSLDEARHRWLLGDFGLRYHG